MQFFVVLNSGWEANTYIYECAATVLVNHWSIVICDSHKMPSPFGHQFLTTANDREKKRSEHKQDNKTEFEWSYMFNVKWHKVFIHVRILFVRCFCSVVFFLCSFSMHSTFVPFRFFLFLAQSVFFFFFSVCYNLHFLDVFSINAYAVCIDFDYGRLILF